MRRQNRYNRNHKSNAKKERIVMIASSAFVLAALTMTGVYVKNSSEQSKNDGYNIDFSVLEDKQQNDVAKDQYTPLPEVTEDDLDYTPMEQVDSGIVEIPGLTNRTADTGNGALQGSETMLDELANPAGVPEDDMNLSREAEPGVDTARGTGEGQPQKDTASSAAGQTAKQVEPDFKAGDTLVWPVNGTVLIPYSMDKTVYFSTLAQYKYNPALIISATEGDIISAAAGGKVTDVFFDEEIGNAVTVDIGNGYEITYGQLKDVAVSEGNYLAKGSIIGYVAAPTKYYSVEGTNAYFALTQNGEPADPMGELQ